MAAARSGPSFGGCLPSSACGATVGASHASAGAHWGLLLMINSRMPTTFENSRAFSPLVLFGTPMWGFGAEPEKPPSHDRELFGLATAPARGFDLLFGGSENAEVARVESAETTTPSAARPRFKSSRMAEARLGIRLSKRQSSSAANSSSVSMI